MLGFVSQVQIKLDTASLHPARLIRWITEFFLVMLTGLDRIIGPFSLETMGRSGPGACKRSKYSLLLSMLAERTIHEKLAAITDLLVKMMSGNPRFGH